MPSLTVTILQGRSPYTLRFDDARDHSKNSVFQNVSEERLRAKLEEVLSLSDDDLRKIISALERMNFIETYPVDDAAYELVFG